MKCTRRISVKFPYTLFKTGAHLLLLLIGWLSLSVAQSFFQATFPSAEKATGALFEAVQKDDEDAIARVLGDKDLVSTGDSAADRQDRELFLEKYRQMHRLVQEADGATSLYIGAENWPFPVSLISKNGSWFFDGNAGKQEVLFRRIGENEEYSLENCIAISASGQPPSDIVHGYYFRKVGENGGSGAGHVILIAYPAEYRSSGVMTFVVRSNHAVFEKDLGPQTASIAKTVKTLKVDGSWRRAE